MNATEHNANIALTKIIGLKKGETITIVTNPKKDLMIISRALAKIAKKKGAKPLPNIHEIVPKTKIKDKDGFLIVQPIKISGKNIEPYVYKVLEEIPDVFISIPEDGLGRDTKGLKKPYKGKKKKYNNLFAYSWAEGKFRTFWSPHVTLPMWNRAIDINYTKLRKQTKKLSRILTKADKVHITTKKGTDFWIGLKGRKCFVDDGDFRKKGTGGNVPTGEAFISPQLNTCRGTLIMDACIPLRTGEVADLSKDNITLEWNKGFITDVKGGKNAKKLLSTIKWAEKQPYKLFKNKAKAKKYSKNARNCGELGIGLNPKAIISRTVLEDEKVLKTCHLAIGKNYDEDAPSMIHLDGVVHKPTIIAHTKKRKRTILKNGTLKI